MEIDRETTMILRQAGRAIGCILLGLAFIAAAPAPIVVTGAGSTFVNPILSKWTADYMADFHASGPVCLRKS